ncbi:MAG: MFS transporter [Woeseiaceae bacterium]|jgi:MFS family permease
MKSPIAVFRRLTLVPQGIIVVVSAFLPIFAIVSMFPALPSIMGHFADNPMAGELVPLMVTAPGLAIAIIAPFAGYFVDRFGRVPLLVWATLLYGIFGTAPFFLNDLSLIFATRLALGVCEAAILTVVNTLIGDYWDDGGRRDWLFMQGVAGPIMGALVIRASGPVTELVWNGVFLIYGIAFIVFILMKLYLFEPEKPGHEESQRASNDDDAATSTTEPFPLRSMIVVGGVTLFASIIYYVYMVKGALVFHEVGITSPSRISELSALPALMVMVGAVVFRLLGGKPNGVQIGAFFLFIGVGLFMMGTAESIKGVVAGIVVQQVGIGMSVPALIAWTQTKLTFAHRGLGMGIWTSCFFFGQFISPWMSARAEGFTGSVQGAFAAAGVAAMGAAAIGLGWGLLRGHAKDWEQRS